jgi:uncharacterized membrane protein YvbJ
MKHYCPMCGEQWNEDVCQSCGWQESPRELNAIADTVLAYRPKARSKPAVQRKRRKTILEKKRAEQS